MVGGLKKIVCSPQRVNHLDLEVGPGESGVEEGQWNAGENVYVLQGEQ